ncbi:GNAT family N-acetyltransferase [Pedobacter metabolipauper]|uniref:Acetyltransferase (GNAT) family protein n=1 Tax=Pedobacter metabolipauper TaxID=425513 RepID=A0A4R6SWZ3_9SPHI|nr:GNAT family N-acetyltransferase [Pedobacter metabolipauper]TDQ09936.1 acetyltransferase (GNAT) family protein [Pedobacter metabolipauper]
MQIRTATEKDIPGIIELLRLSLGESLIPKSEKFWRWKHIDNPFGASMVLLAEQDGQLIGLRAFMNWQWQLQGKIYRAVRAVDTATHPDHQGKGIFKKLTLQGLDEVKSLGVSFVYNTPNQKSKPGYLKMGWKEQGRMPLKFNINPFGYKGKMPVETTNWSDLRLADDFFHIQNQGMHTQYSQAYLTWRYAENPIFNYHYLTDNSSYFLAYRYKEHSFGAELRITDLLINKKNFGRVQKKQLGKALNSRSKKVALISVSGNNYKIMQNYYPFFSIFPIVNKGPIVTFRNIQLESEAFDQLIMPEQWAYSLGDLELF